jgi:hypothetical protein
MTRFALLALLALGASAVQAQPTVRIGPNVDSAEELQTLRNLSACLAESRPRWARQTLAHPYLSDDQARVAAQALRGYDACVKDETEVTFRTSGLVGGLAEHFLRSEIQRADFSSLTGALATITPLNVSEDFALCVAVRNPAAARDLALSEPGSAAEMQAAAKLSDHLPPCIQQGEKPAVDLQSLRALMSTALYRGVTTILGE